jgi:hypothetical protein
MTFSHSPLSGAANLVLAAVPMIAMLVAALVSAVNV